MGMEMHALFLDLPKSCKRKHLKSAGIRQDRFVPVHKLMQSAELFYNLISRSHMKMICIG